MTGNTTTTNPSVEIRAEVYSDMLLERQEDMLLAEGLSRDVSEFSDGSNFNIPVIGNVQIVELTEDTDTPMNPMTTGKVSLKVTEHKGTGLYITDEQKEDSYIGKQLEAAFIPTTLREIKEAMEIDFLAQANKGIDGTDKSADNQAFNGADHRYVASGGVISLLDFQYAGYALDKAKAPKSGRIAIITPEAEFALNTLIGNGFQSDAKFLDLLGEGWAKERNFVTHIFGFDVWVSNYLPTTDATGLNAGGTAGNVTVGSDGLKANLFMTVADDSSKPIMSVVRRAVMVEGDRNKSKRRDEFYVSSRYGYGIQREENMVVVYTNATL